MPLKRNYLYPLKIADRFDDDFGKGYRYALLADRGSVPLDCWVHDAWIVKRNGKVHPGLCETPVPVRLEDIDETNGRHFQPAHV